MYDEHIKNVTRHGQRHQVLDRVIRHFGVETRIDRDRPDRCQHQCVAIRRRFCRYFNPNHTASPKTVIHNHLLSETLGKLWCHRTRQQISRRPRRKRHDKTDRLGRPGLRLRLRGRRRKHETASKDKQCDGSGLHADSPSGVGRPVNRPCHCSAVCGGFLREAHPARILHPAMPHTQAPRYGMTGSGYCLASKTKSTLSCRATAQNAPSKRVPQRL